MQERPQIDFLDKEYAPWKDKKIRKDLKQAQDAAEQAGKKLNDAMQELEDDALDAIAGGDNPFADIPRAPPSPSSPMIGRKLKALFAMHIAECVLCDFGKGATI